SALGSSLEVIVLGRVMQGVGGGIFPLCFGIIRDEFPAEKVSLSIGLISAIAGIGGGLGLIIGGLLVDHLSWHWIFWAGSATAVVAAVAALLFIPESPNRTPGKVDLRGAAVLGIGLSIPLYAVTEASSWGWTDVRTLSLFAAGIVILAGWVALQRRTREPLADVSLLTRPPVLFTNLATLFVGFGMFASFVLIPQLVAAPPEAGYGFAYTATKAGLVMLPAALMMLFAGPVSGLIGGRFGNKYPLAIGALISAAGLTGLGLDHGTTLAIILWNMVGSIGIGLAMAAMPNLIMESVPMARTGEATGFNVLIRSVGASLGSQVTASILTGTIVAGALLPTDHGFKIAFLFSAGVSLLAAGLAMMIPRSGHQHAAVAEEIGAAGPLGEPALAAES
ncbi:MAG: MFS transporter, partial [Actinomycetota bacterium]|nr:MFS transporter [Actinomycetota bacterium]